VFGKGVEYLLDITFIYVS